MFSQVCTMPESRWWFSGLEQRFHIWYPRGDALQIATCWLLSNGTTLGLNRWPAASDKLWLFLKWKTVESTSAQPIQPKDIFRNGLLFLKPALYIVERPQPYKTLHSKKTVSEILPLNYLWVWSDLPSKGVPGSQYGTRGWLVSPAKGCEKKNEHSLNISPHPLFRSQATQKWDMMGKYLI